MSTVAQITNALYGAAFSYGGVSTLAYDGPAEPCHTWTGARKPRKVPAGLYHFKDYGRSVLYLPVRLVADAASVENVTETPP